MEGISIFISDTLTQISFKYFCSKCKRFVLFLVKGCEIYETHLYFDFLAVVFQVPWPSPL